MPAVAACESKIQLQRDELEQMSQVMARFDLLLTQKQNKQQLDDYKIEVRADYVLKSDVQEFKDDSLRVQAEIQEKVSYLDDIVKSQTKTFERQMFSNIRRAIDNLQSHSKASLSDGAVDL